MAEENKREKFVRLAENRTNRIIDQIELLGNLSNTSAYEYSEKDVDKMFKAIENALSDSKKRYSKQNSKESRKFTFGE
ncbi:MAG: hypothetical protein LKF81_11240 [Prevotella sp.]|nr:hypothetical protein [Prevotella sp.]